MIQRTTIISVCSKVVFEIIRNHLCLKNPYDSINFAELFVSNNLQQKKNTHYYKIKSSSFRSISKKVIEIHSFDIFL